MFGISRSRAAELLAQDLVQLDGRPAAKSDRLVPGRAARRHLPAGEADPLEVVAELVDGLTIIHDDDDIVVVDKPVGVAVHPSMGWTGPTVVGHLRGAGYRIATSGAPERRGIVQRLDVGTSGVMVIAKSEHAYSRAQERLPPPRGRQDLPRARPGPSRSARGHDRRPHRAAHQLGLEVRGHARTASTASPTTRPSRRTGSRACSRSTWRPAAPTRSGCTWPRCKHPCVGDLTYGADPTLATQARAGAAVAARRDGSASSTPAPGSRSSTSRPIPTDLAHALEVIRDAD